MKGILGGILLYLLTINCGGQKEKEAKPSPQLTKAQAVAEKEEEFQLSAGETETRAEARQAAIKFATEHLPKWKIQGVQSEAYANGTYRVAVDIGLGKRRESLVLVVARFFPEEGEPYWQAHLLTNTLRDALHDTEDYERLKKLNEATEEPEPDPGDDYEP